MQEVRRPVSNGTSKYSACREKICGGRHFGWGGLRSVPNRIRIIPKSGYRFSDQMMRMDAGQHSDERQ
jgi:hypothetical protein